MKYRTIALAAAQAAGSTTRAWCWYFEQANGTVKTVTTWARDLLIDGLVYKAKDGVNPMAIESTADGAVSNSEITGALSSDFVTEEQVLSGVWDNCFVSVFEVNARDLSMGRMILVTGTLGELSCGRMDFKAEIRSLSQALQQTTGRTFSPLCDAQLGDARCKVDVESMRVAGTIESVSSRRSFADPANTGADDLFGAGVVRIESGPMSGAQMEVYSYDGLGNFSLVLPFGQNLTPGTAYSVIPGCRKRHERGARNPFGVSDCKDKFNNILNFRGFPPSQFPGNNRILGLGSNASTSFNP